MADLAVYSFRNVSAVMGGIPIKDFMPGDDVVRIQRPGDLATPQVGADGRAIINVSQDESAIIELKLKPSSDSNSWLAAQHLLLQRALVVTPFPVLISDIRNGEGYAAAEGVVIASPGDIQFGTATTQRLWRVFVGKLTRANLQIVA